MVRDPSSAHIAVAPQPATTSTVDIGPMYTTQASAAPVPDRSAAPISTSRMLMMKTANALNGIETMKVGKLVAGGAGLASVATTSAPVGILPRPTLER